jgi:hypothetical protein
MNGGGWVVVSFIGPAGLDVRKLAAAMLFGGGQSGTGTLPNAAANALTRSRKLADAQEKLLKVVEKNAMARKSVLQPPAGQVRPRAGKRRAKT